MFDIGMAEMAVIGVVALIVVGPKDLPQMFRKVGQFVGKARGMARDFQRAMEQAADETGVNDISADLKQATSMKNLGLDDATSSFQNYQKKFDPKKVSAAAEQAKRELAVKEANKAAENWVPDVPVVTDSEVVQTPVPAKKPATKKSVAGKKTVAAKKPATATKKATTAKKTVPAKKPAAKKTAAVAKPKTTPKSPKPTETKT